MTMANDELQHEGTKGMHWGIRKYQYEDGTYTEAGKERYFGSGRSKEDKYKLKQKAVKDHLKNKLEKEKLKAEINETKHRKKLNKLEEKAAKDKLKKENEAAKREAASEKERLKAEKYEQKMQKKLDKQDEKDTKASNRSSNAVSLALTSAAVLYALNKYKGSKKDSPIAEAMSKGEDFVEKMKSTPVANMAANTSAVGPYLGSIGFGNTHNGRVVFDI